MVSNSLGFYWSVLSAAGPGGSLDRGRMCPLPEPSTLAKNFQTKGRDIFSHGLLGPPERGAGQTLTREVRGRSEGKLAVKPLKLPNVAAGPWPSRAPVPILVRAAHETLNRIFPLCSCFYINTNT